MGRKIIYTETGEIEKVCYREGCYYCINGICANTKQEEKIKKLWKKCKGREECKEWRKDSKWKEKKR